MLSLRGIKRKIKTVFSTQKITRSMKMVSAAKLKRAQASLIPFREYSDEMKKLIVNILMRTPDYKHPYLEKGKGNYLAIIVVTGDRGLCGSYNSNIIRCVERFIKDKTNYTLITVGKKGREYFSRRKQPVVADIPIPFHKGFNFSKIKLLKETVIKLLNEGRFSEFYIAWTQFHSALNQKPVIERLIPLIERKEEWGIKYIVEPDVNEFLGKSLDDYLFTRISRCIIESTTSEFAARMTAMENATTNASDIIRKLTLQYNKARQASITKELMDIINGKEALQA